MHHPFTHPHLLKDPTQTLYNLPFHCNTPNLHSFNSQSQNTPLQNCAFEVCPIISKESKCEKHLLIHPSFVHCSSPVHSLPHLHASFPIHQSIQPRSIHQSFASPRQSDLSPHHHTHLPSSPSHFPASFFPFHSFTTAQKKSTNEPFKNDEVSKLLPRKKLQCAGVHWWLEMYL